MQARRVVFVTPGRDAKTIESFAAFFSQHHGTPEQVSSVSIDISPALIKDVGEHLPNARVTFDKFHVVANASKVLDTVRANNRKPTQNLKGCRWSQLQDANKLNLAQFTNLEGLLRQYTTKRTACAWLYREQLREILERK